MQQLAVLRYVQGGVDTGGLLLGSGVGDQLQADQYAEIAAQASAQDVDAYEASLQDLGRAQALVETAKQNSAKAAKNLDALRKKLEQKIVALQKAEEKRKKDALVRRALEAAVAEQRRVAEAAAAQAAAEAAASRRGLRRRDTASRPASTSAPASTAPWPVRRPSSTPGAHPAAAAGATRGST